MDNFISLSRLRLRLPLPALVVSRASFPTPQAGVPALHKTLRAHTSTPFQSTAFHLTPSCPA